MSRRPQRVERPIDRTVVAQLALGKPAVEGDTEFFEILADVVEDSGERQIEHAAERCLADQGPGARNQRVDVRVLVAALRLVRRQTCEQLRSVTAQAGALCSEQPLADGRDVVAAIAVRRKSESLAAVLQIPQPGADRQDVHLAASIVDVVFALDAIAHGLQQIGNGGAVGSVPAVADMQGPRRIRRHEFHLRRSPRTALRSSIAPAVAQHLGDFGVIGLFRQVEIDEARPRDVHLGDIRARRQQLHQGLRQLSRILARGFGKPHGEVAGEITVLGVPRVLDLDAHIARRGGHQVLRQLRHRMRQQFFNQGLQGESVGFSTKGRQFTANASIHFQRIDIDGPSQAGWAGQHFDQRQPILEEALQCGA